MSADLAVTEPYLQHNEYLLETPRDAEAFVGNAADTDWVSSGVGR